MRERERESPHQPSPKIKKIKKKIPLPTYLPTYLSTYLPTYLPTYPPKSYAFKTWSRSSPLQGCRSHHYPHNKLKNAEKMFDFGQQKQAELLHYINNNNNNNHKCTYIALS